MNLTEEIVRFTHESADHLNPYDAGTMRLCEDWLEQAATIRELRSALERLIPYVVVEECDYPSETPVVVGYKCLECRSEASSQNIPHAPDCPFSKLQKETPCQK